MTVTCREHPRQLLLVLVLLVERLVGDRETGKPKGKYRGGTVVGAETDTWRHERRERQSDKERDSDRDFSVLFPLRHAPSSD